MNMQQNHQNRSLPRLIKTPRLIMRPLAQEDRDILYTGVIETLDLLVPWLPWAEEYRTSGPRSAEIAIRQFEAEMAMGQAFNFACFSNKNFVGVVGLLRPDIDKKTIEIGYWCVKSQQSYGYITEAANALIRFAFIYLLVHKIFIICDEKNERSAAVAERLGFKLERIGLGICSIEPDRICKRYVISNPKMLPNLPVIFKAHAKEIVT